MSALVLVADSDPFNLHLLSELCSTLGYDVMTAADGGAVLDAMARQKPELVLMDAALPVMDGFAVLRILKADGGLCNVPILLVTREDDSESRERGLKLGADDYVTKPYRTFEIQQRLRNVLQLKEARDAASSGSIRPQTIDVLTNTGTAGQLHISLDYEFTRAVRYKHPLSCVVVRCLDYEELAAKLGASAPELIIGPLASAVRGGIRNVDHMFRSDTHELTILLPETGPKGARIVVDRLRGLVAAPGLFTALAPIIAVASASYPKQRANDGDALWRAAQSALRE
ncbi:MAG TPA: response regulator [Polyangiales bacterium]|jgi:PleD family two-component response regulator|nr:response regulator [Polyangiales bacterium]